MNPYDRTPSYSSLPPMLPPPTHLAAGDAPRPDLQPGPPEPTADSDTLNVNFMKGPKRKRLAKACDACHKSKRRCDGTAPCSNCFYAQKTCTYTDASGRPVPAPRPARPTKPSPPPVLPEPPQPPPQQGPYSAPHASYDPYSPESSTSARLPPFAARTYEIDNPRKRLRPDQRAPILLPTNPDVTLLSDRHAELDPALTIELVNLFFTHCHPQRIMIHKPTFQVDLSQNRVPSYLLNAMCAVSARFSKQPRIRTNPPRIAGSPFAKDAIAMMFNEEGRLISEPTLATAQALCLLQIHDIVCAPSTWTTRYQGAFRYHELALGVLEKLDVHKADNPILTPLPSPEFVTEAIERECIRRVFWLVFLVDQMMSVWFKRSLAFNEQDLRLRLPVDETSFELSVHASVSEYLFLNAPRTHYASEFGHLIRAFAIYGKVEAAVNTFIGPQHYSLVLDSEKMLERWVRSLPSHLRYESDSLQVQLSMFETSSNTSAWCYCLMHVVHAGCELALNAAKQRANSGVQVGPEWALERLGTIVQQIGKRARHSTLLASAVWPLMKYYKSDDEQIQAWSDENYEVWGCRVEDYVPDEWKSPRPAPAPRYSPPTPPRAVAESSRHIDTHSQHAPSPSEYQPSSLGHSLSNLRIHNSRPSAADGRVDDPRDDHDRRRRVSDADIDPALQAGRHPSGEQQMSLPSLKASGLLDSWNEGPHSTHTSPVALAHPIGESRNNSPFPIPPSGIYATNKPTADPSRLPSSGMPIGMQWLAHEPPRPR
ncbi:hypothetical protein PLICRDRAFT_255310 [Plicaturopsis crispa FD-325 SS-3]|nr:hypothetical protein PLICRDRAFT_255310 [Plicaturopsis crispa FD-325 SS-3]